MAFFRASSLLHGTDSCFLREGRTELWKFAVQFLPEDSNLTKTIFEIELTFLELTTTCCLFSLRFTFVLFLFWYLIEHITTNFIGDKRIKFRLFNWVQYGIQRQKEIISQCFNFSSSKIRIILLDSSYFFRCLYPLIVISLTPNSFD